MNSDFRTRYDLALEAAHRASDIALGYFDAELNVEWKPDESPVTVADRETEAFLRSSLLTAFPRDGFLGEESGDVTGSSGYRWIIDPIDGTRSFVRGIPIWATLIGLEYKSEMIAGVVRVPAMDLTYRALRGDGAYRGDRRVHVSDIGDLGKAQIFYSSISWFVKAGCQQQFLELAARTERQRGFGDFYGYMLVAQGSGEVMVEYGTSPWDVAAIKPIVEEAGGRYSNWDGGQSIHHPDNLVTNGKLHDEVLRHLQTAKDIKRAQNA